MLFRRPHDSGEAESLSFREVFARERQVIAEARRKRAGAEPPADVNENLIGLAFSGGGIRSATFNLGVLQALAQNKLLTKFDYLSTVSGGGYIGSWLSSWAYHIGTQEPAVKNHIGVIQDELNRTAAHVGDSPEPKQVFFLRKYSNYLTPRLGSLSGDTLAFVAIYLRNLLLNQFVLIAALLALLLVPRALGMVFAQSIDRNSILACLFLGIALLIASFVQILWNMDPDHAYTPRKVVYLIALPLFLFCVLFAYGFWQVVYLTGLDGQLEWYVKAGVVAVCTIAYFALWAMASIFAPSGRAKSPTDKAPASDGGLYLKWASALWAAPAGMGAGVLVLCGIPAQQYWIDREPMNGGWKYMVTFGIPLTTAIVLLVGVIHLGLLGRLYEDRRREWWARLGGTIIAFAIYWFLISLATLFIPGWLRSLWDYLWAPNNHWYQYVSKGAGGVGLTSLLGGWITATFKGLTASRNRQAATTPTNGADSSPSAKNLAEQLAPPIFAAGLIVILSLVLQAILGDLPNLQGVFVLCVGLYALSRFLGYRVDANEFSLHNAYRNRLVRCYLGATNDQRKAQPFTGFDESDNIYLHSLLNLGAPFHILNATLNVVKGKELALQARKARSFTFTPLYSGFEYTGDEDQSQGGSYRLTENCSLKSRYPGARLGTAMAISGAAMSPSMGRYTSGAMSFLLTIFSVRLGWWLGNPRFKKAWESGYPRSSWRAIVNELTGNTNDDQKEIYLSDGGHFENLGIYELVRRRCRVIVACDAGADREFKFTDLACAIEKCRVDFGVEIKINVDDIRPATSPLADLPLSAKPFAIGTIEYPGEKENSVGTLIYLKPSLISGLPPDVIAYARSSWPFPHQSTLDQFYDETQFESYRALGFACASGAMREVKSSLEAGTTTRVLKLDTPAANPVR